MKREELQQLFPDIYDYFKEADEQHPFWKAVEEVESKDAKAGKTLLTDMEQVFSSLHMVQGNEFIKDHINDIDTYEELMELFTKLYVAYIYRTNGVRMVRDVYGYDVEMEIADQLLVMGIVTFHDFRAPRLQFAEKIGDEVEHLKIMQETAPEDRDELDDEIDAFIEKLKTHAQTLKEHPKAKHQVIASISKYHGLPEEFELARRIKERKAEMQEHFPHIAGVILVDPNPGSESAHFVPFHEGKEDLEQLLTKNNT